MSAHILQDVRLKDGENSYGFCLSTSTACINSIIYSLRGSKGTTSIDMKSSRCLQLRKISLKSAATFYHASKCSNHPLACPLCIPKSPAVWKYNLLRSHIVKSHPTADVELYKTHFEITPDEGTLMMKSVIRNTGSPSDGVWRRQSHGFGNWNSDTAGPDAARYTSHTLIYCKSSKHHIVSIRKLSRTL